MRAWLEDGAADFQARRWDRLAPFASDEPRRARVQRTGSRGVGGDPVIVRDGARVVRPAARGADTGSLALQELFVKTIFRLVVTGYTLRQPFEDALCALSATEEGPAVLETLSRLPVRQRSALRAFVQARADAITAQWGAIPSAWLPRTAERLRVPLAGGAVTLVTEADLVIGRPADVTSSVCLVRLSEQRRGDAIAAAARTRRALALGETLRSGSPPWRVATYDPALQRLETEEVGERLLVGAVRDVLAALQAVDAARRGGTTG